LFRKVRGYFIDDVVVNKLYTLLVLFRLVDFIDDDVVNKLYTLLLLFSLVDTLSTLKKILLARARPCLCFGIDMQSHPGMALRAGSEGAVVVVAVMPLLCSGRRLRS
jgi:hypothetical protein